jgi:hypothetical protein
MTAITLFLVVFFAAFLMGAFAAFMPGRTPRIPVPFVSAWNALRAGILGTPELREAREVVTFEALCGNSALNSLRAGLVGA